MMNRKYLLGVAAAALLTAGGAAQAADVLPIMVTPVAPEVAAYNPLTIEIETGLAFDIYPGDYTDLWAYLDGEITYETLTGWGVTLSMGGGTGINYSGAEAGAAVEVYRSLGALSLGLVAGGYGYTYGYSYYFAGPTLGYETDNIEIDAALLAYFEGGDYDGAELTVDGVFTLGDRLAVGAGANLYFWEGLDDWEAYAEAAFGVTDTITLRAAVEFEDDDRIDFAVAAEIALGAFKPYVGAVFDGDNELVVGVNVEHQIGTGPFTLFANLEAQFERDDNPEYLGGIGVRFNYGDADDDNLGFFDTLLF